MQVSKGKLMLIGFGILAVVIIIASFNLKKPSDTQNSMGNNAQKIADNKSTPQVKIETLRAGTSDRSVRINDFVLVNYTGMFTDSTVFDSSYERNQPYGFYVGQGKVIKGWDQGLIGMKIGEKRRLTIPPQFAYGERGAYDSTGKMVIPPNSTLVFEIELSDIK